MKRILLLILAIAYLGSAESQVVTYRMAKLAETTSWTGGNFDGGMDDPAICVTVSGKVFLGGGTDNSTVFNDFYRSDDSGRTWTALATPPWSVCNAGGYCTFQTDSGQRGFMWGQNATLAYPWAYCVDSTGKWTKITDSMKGSWVTGMTGFAFWKDGNYAYVVGGPGNANVIRTNNFKTWETVAAAPAGLSGAAPMRACIFKGSVFVAGASSNYLWRSDNKGVTWYACDSGSKYGDQWPNLGATNEMMFLIRGTAGGNKKGCYYTLDAKNWIQFPYSKEATHACGITLHPSGVGLLVLRGNDFLKRVWWVKRDANPKLIKYTGVTNY